MDLSEIQQTAWEIAEEKGFHAARGSGDIFIRFAGESPNLEFVEVENEDGESIDVGEWTHDEDGPILRIEQIDPTPIALALIHSEVTEALEADRREQENFGEELADIVIRVADLAGEEGIDLEREVEEKMAKNADRPELHGGKQY